MNTLAKMQKVGSKAFQTVTKVSGSSDPQVDMYKKLTPREFDAIAQQFGDNGLVEYVQAMEAKILKGGTSYGAKS